MTLAVSFSRSLFELHAHERSQIMVWLTPSWYECSLLYKNSKYWTVPQYLAVLKNTHFSTETEQLSATRICYAFWSCSFTVEGLPWSKSDCFSLILIFFAQNAYKVKWALFPVFSKGKELLQQISQKDHNIPAERFHEKKWLMVIRVFKKIIYIYNVLHNKHQTHVNETGSGSDNLSLVWRDRLQHWYQQHCARTVKYSWETMSERCNILYIYEVTATLTRRKPTQLSETDLCLFLLFFNIVWNGIYTRYILCLST